MKVEVNVSYKVIVDVEDENIDALYAIHKSGFDRHGTEEQYDKAITKFEQILGIPAWDPNSNYNFPVITAVYTIEDEVPIFEI